MKRERTKDFDVLRQGSTISIVERRSGVASSFVVPSEEAREALVRVLSEPIEVETKTGKEADQQAETQAESAPVEVSTTTESEEKKTTTTNNRTKKESATK